MPLGDEDVAEPRDDEGNDAPRAATTLRRGMKVFHDRFGYGEVESVEGAGEKQKATVRFSTWGRKTLMTHIARLEKGVINNHTKLILEKETETTALYNANNGWGQYAGKVAMEKAIEKAQRYGSAFVGVNHSNHFGTAAYFTRMAADADCLGIALTNTSPIMVPWGAKKPTLGTNPISIAVPAKQYPIVLDMATSNVARAG